MSANTTRHEDEKIRLKVNLGGSRGFVDIMLYLSAEFIPRTTIFSEPNPPCLKSSHGFWGGYKKIVCFFDDRTRIKVNVETSHDGIDVRDSEQGTPLARSMSAGVYEIKSNGSCVCFRQQNMTFNERMSTMMLSVNAHLEWQPRDACGHYYIRLNIPGVMEKIVTFDLFRVESRYPGDDWSDYLEEYIDKPPNVQIS